MPISDNVLNQKKTSGIPVIAKLRKGSEQTVNKNGKTVSGRNLSHFRVTFSPTQIFTEQICKGFEADFAQLYGDEPTRIEGVRLFTGDEATIFPNDFELWKTSAKNSFCARRCDGETMRLWMEGGKFQRGAIPCPGYDAETGERSLCGETEFDSCKPKGRLFVMLDGWNRIHPERPGLFQIDTGSLGEIAGIARSLSRARYVADVLGVHFMQLDFILERTPVTRPRPDGTPTKDWEVSLTLNPQWTGYLAEYALPSGPMTVTLPVGDATPRLPETVEGDYTDTDANVSMADEVAYFDDQPEPDPIDDVTKDPVMTEGETQTFTVVSVERQKAKGKNVSWFVLETDSGDQVIHYGSRGDFVSAGLIANKGEWEVFGKLWRVQAQAKAIAMVSSKGELYWKMSAIAPYTNDADDSEQRTIDIPF